MDQGEVVVHHAAGEVRARQVKSLLAAHGIPCQLRGAALREHRTNLEGLGEIAVLVPGEFAAPAQLLLDRMERGELGIDAAAPGPGRGEPEIDDGVPYPGRGEPRRGDPAPGVGQEEPDFDDGFPHDPGALVVVYHAPGEGPAQLIKSLLAAHGIRCHLRGEALRKTHGFTLDGLGNVAIMVTSGNAPQARRLLDRMERGELAIDENTPLDAG